MPNLPSTTSLRSPEIHNFSPDTKQHPRATSISYQCGKAHGSTFHLMEPVEMWHPSSLWDHEQWQAQEARKDWHYRNGSQNDEQELTTTGIRRIDSSGTRLACWNCWIRKHRHLRHHRRRCHGRNMSSRGGRLPFHEKANEYFLLFFSLLFCNHSNSKRVHS